VAELDKKYKIDLTKSTSNWSRSIKIKRVIWQIFISPLFMMLPRPANKTRIWLLRLMGAIIGHRCLIEPRVKILMPWNMELGDYVVIGHDAEIYNYALVRINSMTVVSQYTYLCTGTHDYTHPHMPLIWSPITIGSECWVAAGAFIAPGVTIGNGAVIGANSVVSKDMPEWMVCAGNPCKPLKQRVIKEL
jgi:putative colanic acid biosynthesis acetyltransferase WcaF